MVVVIRIVAGVLLIAHGLVHLLYLSSDLSEFSLDRSWLVPESGRRPVASVLMVATVIAFTLLALALWQVPGLNAVWPTLTVVAAAASTALLVLFWNWQLVFGLVINALLVAAAVVQPTWLERFVTGG